MASLVFHARQGLYPAVKGGAIDPQQLCRLTEIALGEPLRGFYVGFFPQVQGVVKAEILTQLQVMQSRIDQLDRIV